MDTRELSGEQVPVYRPSWDQIVQGTIKVSLHIQAWRGKKRIDLADLGLEQLNEKQKAALEENILTLGHKRLLPHEYTRRIQQIETQARRLLEAYSYQTEFGYLVPKKQYARLKEAMETLQSEFYNVRNEITTPQVYAKNIDILKEAYKKLAVTAWQIITQGTAAEETEAPQDFIDSFVDRIVSQIPSPEQIKEKFTFEWTPAYVQLPSEIAADAAEAQRIRQEWELTELDKEIREKAARETMKKVANTVNTFTTYLRNLLYEASTEVLAGIQKNGTLVGSQAKRLKKMIEEISRLNFTDDEEIEAIRQRLEEALGNNRKDRDIEEINRVLRQIGTVTRAELMTLGNIPRSARHLNIPDTITLGEYRQARDDLLSPGEVPADTIAPDSRQPRQLSLTG
jgi:hypothetical protein